MEFIAVYNMDTNAELFKEQHKHYRPPLEVSLKDATNNSFSGDSHY